MKRKPDRPAALAASLRELPGPGAADPSLPPLGSPAFLALVVDAIERSRTGADPHDSTSLVALRRRYLGLPVDGPADGADLDAVPPDHPTALAFREALTARTRLRQAALREQQTADVATVLAVADRHPRVGGRRG